MEIIIPTYRRTGNQHSYNALGPKWRDKVTFVTDQKDADFMRSMSKFKDARFTIVPEEIQTIAQKRAWILKTAQCESLVMLDDDLRFAVRKYPCGYEPGIEESNFKLVAADCNQVDFFFDELEVKLKSYVHAGFSARQGNNRKPPGWEKNTRMMYVLGYQPEAVRQHCELGRIETREDFDYTLQLFKKGFENIICNEICTDQKYNAPGGASLERTKERSDEDAEKLAALHPGLVKVVYKDYAGSVKRKEVIVQWKKALRTDIAA